MPHPSSATVRVASAAFVAKVRTVAPESRELATISVRIVSSIGPG